jgi:hypothetical protein
MKTQRKAQVWSADFLTGILIVSLSLALALTLLINTNNSKSFEDISSTLFNEGAPANWNISTITSIGIMSDGRINNTKVTAMYDMERTRLSSYLGVDKKFYIAILNNSVPIIFGGKDFAGYTYSQAKDVYAITRFGIYESSVVEIQTVVWQ